MPRPALSSGICSFLLILQTNLSSSARDERHIVPFLESLSNLKISVVSGIKKVFMFDFELVVEYFFLIFSSNVPFVMFQQE